MSIPIPISIPNSVRSCDIESSPSWFVALTKPRQEQVANVNLTRQGYLTYLPMLKALKTGRPNSKEPATQLEPMFPRYLFFRAQDLQQSIAPVRSSIGVAQVVRFGVEPAKVPLGVLNTIKQIEDEQHNSSYMELSGMRAGEKIRVNKGPFMGLEGIVSEVSAQRVKVLIELLGREANINFELAQLMLVH